MAAAVLAKGQLSYLILSCLEEKDMYGLELIEKIKERSGIEIKLPSLYSNINRMKELKYISSYLKESTKGPKCAYSSITEAGRKELAKLKELFENSEENIIPNEQNIESKTNNEEKIETSVVKENFEDYDDFFAEIPDEDKIEYENSEDNEKIDVKIVSNENAEAEEVDLIPTHSPIVNEEDEVISRDEESLFKNNITETEDLKVENKEESDIIEDISEKNVIGMQQSILNGEEKIQTVKNDAVFLPKDENYIQENSQTSEYNKKLFNVTMDYNKYKKRRSFSENQIEMVVNSSTPIEMEREREKKAENISELKQALLQTRQGNYEEINLDLLNRQDTRKIEKEEEKEEIKLNIDKEKTLPDDGKFITDRVDYVIPSRKFEPPKFTFLNTQQETVLPAPKRDTNIDPNCSDVKARLENLYLKSQIEKPVENVTTKNLNEDFDNYDDLKEYYENQNISFKVFKRTGKRTLHNTNKINFIVELIIFGFMSVCCGLLYLLFSKLGLTNTNTNFMYYLFPILYFIYVMVRLYMFKKVPSKVPRPLFNFVVVIGSAVILSVIVFCLNLACGMSINNIPACSTTLFLPISIILIIFIIRHYIMLFALKKFWR